ncbi:hypothetical protein GCM10010415_25600 [Streptomyces atrovirens]
MTWAASASAPMSVDVVRFWAGFGIVIMDAWGLTETTGVATSNSPRTGFWLGSVGRPVESVEIRVAEDGEILVRGSSVFSGYLRPDGSVRSALDADGRLATGDIGRTDEQEEAGVGQSAAGAAVLLGQAHPEPAQLGEPSVQLGVVGLAAVPRRRLALLSGTALALGEIAHGRGESGLFLGESTAHQVLRDPGAGRRLGQGRADKWVTEIR